MVCKLYLHTTTYLCDSQLIPTKERFFFLFEPICRTKFSEPKIPLSYLTHVPKYEREDLEWLIITPVPSCLRFTCGKP